MSHHDLEGPPCSHMEHMLHDTADGTSRGWRRWYALSHAARCGRCGRFLARLRETLKVMKQAKPEPEADAMSRLKAGRWRDEMPKDE